MQNIEECSDTIILRIQCSSALLLASAYVSTALAMLALEHRQPRGHLHVHSSGATRFDLTNTATGTGGSDGVTFSIDSGTGGLNINQRESQPIKIYTADTERMRIDSQVSILVGSSTAATAGDARYALLQIAGNTAGASGSVFALKRGQAASTMSNGDSLGTIVFTGTTGGDFATIRASVDGSPSGSDFPWADCFQHLRGRCRCSIRADAH